MLFFETMFIYRYDVQYVYSVFLFSKCGSFACMMGHGVPIGLCNRHKHVSLERASFQDLNKVQKQSTL